MSNRSQGFTLLELIIVMAVVAISVTLAAPSLVQTIRNNETASQTYDLLGALNVAKSVGIRRNKDVTVEFTTATNSWGAVVVDPDDTGEHVAGCDELGLLRCTSNADVALILPDGTTEVTFNNRGYLHGVNDTTLASPMTLYLQHSQCSGERQRRRIDITPTGQISSCTLACNSTAACP